MNKFLVITSVAISMVATTTFAAGKDKAAEKAAQVVTDTVRGGPRVKPVEGKVEVKGSSEIRGKNQSTRGAKTAPVAATTTDVLADAAKTTEETQTIIEQCSIENLKGFNYGVRNSIANGVKAGTVVSDTCVAKINDEKAQENLGTIVQAMADASVRINALKDGKIDEAEAVQIMRAGFASYIKVTGRNEAESFKQVACGADGAGTKDLGCLGAPQASLCSAKALNAL